MTALQSDLLNKVPGISHGFGTEAAPGPELLFPNWAECRPRWRQVHGISVAQVEMPAQECGEVDALFALRLDLPIAVVTADCVPVLLARASGGAVAAAHAGWRGTRAGVLASLWAKLQAQGERPGDWVAAIGPAIGPCCYEVSEELAEDFARHFAGLGRERVVPRHRHLDLPLINRLELERIGLGRVEVLGHCTLCSVNPRFHSYRRSPGAGRQLSFISAGSPQAGSSQSE